MSLHSCTKVKPWLTTKHQTVKQKGRLLRSRSALPLDFSVQKVHSCERLNFNKSCFKGGTIMNINALEFSPGVLKNRLGNIISVVAACEKAKEYAVKHGKRAYNDKDPLLYESFMPFTPQVVGSYYFFPKDEDIVKFTQILVRELGSDLGLIDFRKRKEGVQADHLVMWRADVPASRQLTFLVQMYDGAGTNGNLGIAIGIAHKSVVFDLAHHTN